MAANPYMPKSVVLPIRVRHKLSFALLSDEFGLRKVCWGGGGEAAAGQDGSGTPGKLPPPSPISKSRCY